MHSWRPWDEANRTHQSKDDREREAAELASKADQAILYFVGAMHQRGLPDRAKLPWSPTSGQPIGWVYEGPHLSSTQFKRIFVEEAGCFWGLGRYHFGSAREEVPGRWADSIRVRQGNSYVWSGQDKWPAGSFHILDAKAFQGLYIEMIRKYRLPFPPDGGRTPARRRR